MTDTNDPNIWHLVFEQTPKALQWVLGVLTLGLFTLAGWLWRMQATNVERVERQIHARMDRVEEHMNNRMDEVNRHLIEIAQNTRK